jgi:hypothetical protein
MALPNIQLELTNAAEPAVAQERPSISRYDGRSCCTDVRSGAWAVAADRFARKIEGFLKARCRALAAAERQSVGRTP